MSNSRDTQNVSEGIHWPTGQILENPCSNATPKDQRIGLYHLQATMKHHATPKSLRSTIGPKPSSPTGPQKAFP